MLKKLFTHSFLYAIGPQIPKVANIIVLPLITKYLTPTDYGIYGTILAYTGLLGGVKTLGFEILLVNSFFKKKVWKKYWGRYLGGLMGFNLIFVWIYILLLLLIMPSEVGEDKWLVILLIVIPATLFDVFRMFGTRYFQLSQKPSYIAIVTAVVGVITIFLNLYTIAYLRMGYKGWFIATGVGSFLTFSFYIFPLIKKEIVPVFTGNKNFWKKSLKVSLPTVPHNYSVYLLNSSDRMVMDQLKTPIGQIGLYNLAYIFGGYMEFFGNAVGMAVGPIITGLYSKKDIRSEKQVKVLVFFLQICFISVCAIVSLWAKELFGLLIKNQALSDAYSISIIIIMGYAYRPLYWASVNKLIFYEHTNKLWRISFIAGIINIGLNLIFIPMYGIIAAAVTTFISLVYMGISPFFIKEYRKLENQNFYSIYWMLGIVLITGLVYLLKDAELYIKLTLTGFLMTTVVLYLFKQGKKLNGIRI